MCVGGPLFFLRKSEHLSGPGTHQKRSSKGRPTVESSPEWIVPSMALGRRGDAVVGFLV